MSRWGRLQNTGLAVWTAGAIEETMACASFRIMDFRDQIVISANKPLLIKGKPNSERQLINCSGFFMKDRSVAVFCFIRMSLCPNKILNKKKQPD